MKEICYDNAHYQKHTNFVGATLPETKLSHLLY